MGGVGEVGGVRGRVEGWGREGWGRAGEEGVVGQLGESMLGVSTCKLGPICARVDSEGTVRAG